MSIRHAILGLLSAGPRHGAGPPGAAGQSRFSGPHAVCEGADGTIYIADYGRGVIRIRVLRKGQVSTRATLKTR